MKSIVITFLFFCLFSATAQHQISGTIKDGADGSPVPFATAALLRPDSTAITGMITGDDGKFVLLNVAAGEYILRLSFIGYETAFRRVSVPAQSDLGEISIAESAMRMEEVVVTAARPLIVSRADRYIVNVSGNMKSAGRDALDILRNAPGLLVDHQGAISVLGKNVQVWIDGRPSQLSGEQLLEFLTSLQGSDIDRIEIITNPSSKYDSEGSGGIIDIRTVRGLDFGVNGTITVRYRQGQMDRQNIGVVTNWRREKFNVFGNYTVNRNNIWEKINQTNVLQTLDGNITLDQKSTVKTTDVALRHNLRTGIDYFINPKNTLGVIVNAYYTKGSQSNLKGLTNISPIYDGVSYSTADNIMSGGRDGMQVNMNYQSTFDKIGQQLNFDLDHARFYSNPFMQTNNRYFDANNVMNVFEQMKNINPQIIDVYSAKIDYVQPLSKNFQMEMGAKYNQSATSNDMKYEVFIGNDWQIDPGRTNHFVYTEQISAAYINASQQLGKISLQGGLRGEYTYALGEQRTTDAVNDTSYLNLFPTFFMNYQMSEKQTLGLSYSRRLSRPDFESLNPFEVAVDAYTFKVGNPYLTPAYTHNFQLSHMSEAFMALFSYSNTTGLNMLVPFEDAATQRTGLTYKNFSKNQNISAMTNIFMPTIAKIWTPDLLLQYTYLINTSDETSGKFVNKGGMFTIQLENSFTITPSLDAWITGTYTSKVRYGYYVGQPTGDLSIVIRQMLLNRKMSLILHVMDILNTSKDRLRAQYENVDYALVNYRDSRFAQLTLRYNFGSTTVKAARNRQTGVEDETTRAKTGGSVR